MQNLKNITQFNRIPQSYLVKRFLSSSNEIRNKFLLDSKNISVQIKVPQKSNNLNPSPKYIMRYERDSRFTKWKLNSSNEIFISIKTPNSLEYDVVLPTKF